MGWCESGCGVRDEQSGYLRFQSNLLGKDTFIGRNNNDREANNKTGRQDTSTSVKEYLGLLAVKMGWQ
jgi:hypothetical protein